MANPKDLIPQVILEAMYLVAHYAYDADRWVDVKVELRDQVAAEHRAYFSRRHEISKKHTTNELEKAIVAEWKEITGVDLIMPETDRTMPRLSRSGRLAFNFLAKKYPRGMRSALVSKDDD